MTRLPTLAKIRAVLFDAYGTLFDVYSVAMLAEQLCSPATARAWRQLWRDKQIEYTRLVLDERRCRRAGSTLPPLLGAHSRRVALRLCAHVWR